jgi:hypothetical protein
MTLTPYTFPGLGLIALGIVYLLKPGLFKRGLWLRTSIAQRTMSPEGYLKYMRALGIVWIGIGIALLAWGYANR